MSVSDELEVVLLMGLKMRLGCILDVLCFTVDAVYFSTTFRLFLERVLVAMRGQEGDI